MKFDLNRLVHWLRFNLMYLGKPPWDTGISPPELVEFIQQHPPGRAIDLGCGTGTNLLALGRAGWLVTGVDFAVKAVAAARDKLSREGIPGEVRAGDVSRLAVVQGEYDLVLDIGCFHALETGSRAAYRRNLETILKPGGFFLLYAHWLAEDSPSIFGLTQADFDAFCAHLNLLSRQDSLDRRGRSAVWLLFQNSVP